MSKFEAIFYKDDPQDFLEKLEKSTNAFRPSSKQFELESQYRAAEIGTGFLDLSFFVYHGKTEKAFVLAHKFNDFIGFNGSGVEIYGDLSDKKTINFILDQLTEQADAHDYTTIKIDDKDNAAVLSDLGQELYNRKAVPHTKLRAQQDLTQSEEELHSQIRKSYKALINQGKREIDFSHFDHSNITPDEFEKFKQFHLETAGRQTRPDESWNMQYQMIEQGCATLTTGYMDAHGLVSSALFTDYGQSTSYAVAVYNRDLFDKPLAHANVYLGMHDAKKREQKIFNLGIIPAYNKNIEKEYNIGKFKKGFCNNLFCFVEWVLTV